MNRSLILPKTNYPTFCPGSMEFCKRTECKVDYKWYNVFLSIPYGCWYKDYRQVLENILSDKGFTPIVVERSFDTIPLTKAIAKRICESAHAIVDLSTDEEGRFAAGVLMENGFLRCTMGKDILLVVREDSELPAVAKSLKYQSYRSKQQLEELTAEWLKYMNRTYIKPTTHMLFNNKHPEIRDYEVWFHCDGPTYDKEREDFLRDQWGDPNRRDSLLSGGWSGFELLRKTFNALKPEEHKEVRISDFGKCYVNESGEGRVKLDKPPNCSKLSTSNLYLLDAPITREDLKEKTLNWIMKEALNRLQHHKRNLRPTVNMEIINPSKNKIDSKIDKAFPAEVKKLKYGAGESKVATSAWDYGFIVRTPNPFSDDDNAITLMMAGIHAPATHAAAEVFAVPARARQFADYVVQKYRTDLLTVDFFEAVFEIRRTFYQDDLGEIRWLYFRELQSD